MEPPVVIGFIAKGIMFVTGIMLTAIGKGWMGAGQQSGSQNANFSSGRLRLFRWLEPALVVISLLNILLACVRYKSRI
jgi:hypothetical protein